MLNSVNLNLPNYSQSQNTNYSTPTKTRQNIPFGYREEQQSTWGNIKHGVAALTDDMMSFVGVNTALWIMQDFVNGKILVGKINKHFTKDIKDNGKLYNLAREMQTKNELDGKVNIFAGKDGEAFFSHKDKAVVVGKDSFSSLFHELGHATIENKSGIMKNLQRFRGNYTILSLALYGLLSSNKDGNNTKSDALIPLLAFSPELITEAKASHIGLKFLKEKVKTGEIEKSLFKKIRNSYITCFSTYLFIPVSIILIDAIRNSVRKERMRHKMEKMNRMDMMY